MCTCNWSTGHLFSNKWFYLSPSLPTINSSWVWGKAWRLYPDPHWNSVLSLVKGTPAAMGSWPWWPYCIRRQLFRALSLPSAILLFSPLPGHSLHLVGAESNINVPYSGLSTQSLNFIPVTQVASLRFLLTNAKISFSDSFDPAQICPCPQQGWPKESGLSEWSGPGEDWEALTCLHWTLQMGVPAGPSDRVKSRLFTKYYECWDCNCSQKNLDKAQICGTMACDAETQILVYDLSPWLYTTSLLLLGS